MKEKTQWTEWGVLDCLVLDLLDQKIWYQSHWNPARYRTGIITGISATKASILRTDKIIVEVPWETIYS